MVLTGAPTAVDADVAATTTAAAAITAPLPITTAVDAAAAKSTQP